MNHLLNKTFVMVDLETWSTKQNATIIQIGACEFTIGGGITREFLINVDGRTSVQEYGFNVDRSTLQWWSEQAPEVRASLNENKHHITDALTKFNEWIGPVDGKFFISNGAVFDFGILRSSYEVTGIERPWPYWVEMDLRTIATVVDVKLSKGNTHNALEDCKNQTAQFIALFQ